MHLPDDGPLYSIIERLPMKALYLPVAIAWPYFALKYGGFTTPVSANPGIHLGGLCGESKALLYEALGAEGRARFAPFVRITASAQGGSEARRTLTDAGISFPVVVKPDTGRNGRGVKIVRNESDFDAYIAKFPAGAALLAQRYIPGSEANICYVRLPQETRGRITSLGLKRFPELVGDGRSSLSELILADRYVRERASIYLRRNARELDRVIPAGESFPLVSIGNRPRGAVFVEGARHATEALGEALDRIAKEAGLYYVRFDIRFRELADLEAARDFWIVEYNGAGGEPSHVFDARARLFAAYRSLIDHWRMRFEIGAENIARGARRVPIREVLSEVRRESDLLDTYPDEE